MPHLGVADLPALRTIKPTYSGRTSVLSEKEIKDLFSVIPEVESRRAQSELLARLLARAHDRQTRVAWVDLDRHLDALGAGVTDFDGLSSSRINVATDPAKMPPELAELLAVLDQGEVRVGQILLSQLSDRFIWVVPIGPTQQTESRRVSHRALSISFDVLSQLIAMFNVDANLTAAESRVVSQVVAGLSLAESAQMDGLQTETRRGQLKRACAKLSVSGQGALIRLVLSQAIHLLFVIDEQMRASTSISDLASNHLPENVRVELHQMADGRHFRLFEVGDPDGRPVIVSHGMFFVPLLQSLANNGALQGLRFVVPLRYGYLATPEDTAAGDRDGDGVFSHLIKQFEGQSPILMGHLMGCTVAVRFALTHPDLVSRLLLVSPFFGQPREGRAVYISRIMNVVAGFRSDALVFRIVANQFAKSYAKPQNVRTALSRSFGSCQKDTDVISGNAGIPQVDTWFGQIFQDSVNGIAEDFKRASEFTLGELSQLPMPCDVLSGDEDPLIDHAALRAALGADTTLHPIPGAGHFAAITEQQMLLDFLREVKA